MKFFSTLLALLFASLVAAESLSFFGGQKTLHSSNKKSVPGDSPLEFCQDNQDDDILVIKHVNLKPNPPEAYALLRCDRSPLALTGERTVANRLTSKPRASSRKMSKKAHT